MHANASGFVISSSRKDLPMSNMVNRGGVWCEAVQHGWKARVWHCPETDQRETLIYPRMLYIPHGDWDDPDIKVQEVDQSGTLVDEERKARKKEAERIKGQTRAKTKCRHAIKSHSLAQLLTGTYRENMRDFDKVRKDFAAWLRLMRKYHPKFRAVYAFEPQKRGAWHWHAAVEVMPPFFWHKGKAVRSFDFCRRMWQRVVGNDNGTVNVDGHHHRRAKGRVGKRSLAAVAGYVSKYLTKAVDSAIEGRNMWGRTQRLVAPKPYVVELSTDCTIAEAIMAAWHLPDGHRIVRHALSSDGKIWQLYTEPA